MRNLEDEILRTLALAYECEARSDQCFAKGDAGGGSKFFRWSVLAHRHAQDLRRDAARHALARH